MGMEDGLIKYGLGIGVKRSLAAATAAVISYLGSAQFIHALAVLKIVGITVIVDQPVFEKWLVGFATTGAVFLHDWAKCRFPQITWL